MAIGKKTGGRQKGSKNKRKKELATTLAAVADALPEAFEGNSHAFLMAVYKDPGQPLATRLDAAKAALPYEAPRLAPVESGKGRADEDVPLADRLKSYHREAAIRASSGKVIEISAAGRK